MARTSFSLEKRISVNVLASSTVSGTERKMRWGILYRKYRVASLMAAFSSIKSSMRSINSAMRKRVMAPDWQRTTILKNCFRMYRLSMVMAGIYGLFRLKGEKGLGSSPQMSMVLRNPAVRTMYPARRANNTFGLQTAMEALICPLSAIPSVEGHEQIIEDQNAQAQGKAAVASRAPVLYAERRSQECQNEAGERHREFLVQLHENGVVPACPGLVFF